MDKAKRNFRAAFWSICLLIIILDTKTAVYATREAIDMCISVLVPSIFPFLVICPMVSAQIGMFSSAFRPLGRLLRLPEGAEELFVLGILGGYPIGASVVCQAANRGRIAKDDAHRMLAFCSNAGPSFLFGIGAALFSGIGYCAGIWLIHILSAVFVGLMTPGAGGQAKQATIPNASLQAVLRKGLVTMAGICGWVVLFRILLAFAQRWIFWCFAPDTQILLRGLMELANGAVGLGQIELLGKRLLYFSAMLGFGGLCVYMQTASVCQELSIKYYLPGKILQCAVSTLLATAAQFLLTKSHRYFPHPAILLLCTAICVLYPLILRKSKKSSRNSHLIGV